jgi:hypothetical protein
LFLALELRRRERSSKRRSQVTDASLSSPFLPFTEGDDPDVVFESHSHWAVGHVDGFSIRVFDGDGKITEAFRKYHELAEAMDDYPILINSLPTFLVFNKGAEVHRMVGLQSRETLLARLGPTNLAG